MKLQDIADALGGRLDGDGSIEITRVVHPAEAVFAGDLVLAMDRRLLPLLAGTPARAAVIAEGGALPDGVVMAATVVVTRPQTAMVVLTRLFDRPVFCAPGIHPTAVIAPDAEIGAEVSIGPFVVVGPGALIGRGARLLAQVTIGAEAVVGEDCLFHPGVRIGDRVVVGRRVILHHNVSLGGDGFSFVTPVRGSVETAKQGGKVEALNTALLRINSIGTVEIGDDVEIGANSAVDRGTITATRIGANTKIDNLVQIGHNVSIGENCMICGQVGIAGSARIGNRVVLAGQVGVADNTKIGDDAVVGPQSGVGSEVVARAVVVGTPPIPKDQAFDQYLALRRLKTLIRDVTEIKARLKEVKPLEPSAEKD
ncbi:UDP-3-O-acylglucosamine N-acyltransferase [uncultured Gammaproteobacteria bacterium]